LVSSTVTRDEHVIRAALRRYHGAGFKFPPQPQELATRCPLLKPETLGRVLDRAMSEPFSTVAWVAAKTAMRLTSICTLRQEQLDWQPDGSVRLTNVKTKTGLRALHGERRDWRAPAPADQRTGEGVELPVSE
jgi:hypothetical protein